MRRTLIYGTAAAVTLGALVLAVWQPDASDLGVGSASAVAAETHLADYYGHEPDATPAQIAQWEANAAEYEAQRAEVDECRADAEADMDDAPLDDTTAYNAAVDRYNACSDDVDRSLVENHPLYEVDGDTVTYLG
jgi:hypothetical protein